MIKPILSCFLLMLLAGNTFAQDVFFKTGRNFTTYDYKNQDGLKVMDFVTRAGSSFEFGAGFPFSFSSKDDHSNKFIPAPKRNWFKNEVSLAVNSYNAVSGDLNNNYTFETTYGGLKNQLSFLTKVGNLEIGLLGILGANKILSGTQVINNSRFDLKEYDDFRGVFLQAGLGASVAYQLLDKAFLSLSCDYTKSMRPNKQDTEHVNFISRTVLFGIHFNLN